MSRLTITVIQPPAPAVGGRIGPNGRYFTAEHNDGRLTILRPGKRVDRTLLTGSRDAIVKVEFLQENRLLSLSHGGDVTLWDLASHRALERVDLRVNSSIRLLDFDLAPVVSDGSREEDDIPERRWVFVSGTGGTSFVLEANDDALIRRHEIRDWFYPAYFGSHNPGLHPGTRFDPSGRLLVPRGVEEVSGREFGSKDYPWDHLGTRWQSSMLKADALSAADVFSETGVVDDSYVDFRPLDELFCDVRIIRWGACRDGRRDCLRVCSGLLSTELILWWEGEQPRGLETGIVGAKHFALRDDGLVAVPVVDPEDQLLLVDGKSGKILRQLPWGHGRHMTNAGSLRFSSSGRYLVGSRGSDVVLVWDVETGEEVVRIPTGVAILWDVLLSPDERRVLLVAGSSASLWDLEGNRLIEFPGVEFNSAAFSPSGSTLAIGERGGNVRVFRTAPP